MFCLFFVCLFVSSVYNACGLASYDLFDEIDFDQWFTNQLVNEINNPSSRYVAVTCKISFLFSPTQRKS